MSKFRTSLASEADLDGIWLYIARASQSIEIANRVIDNITERFWTLGEHPYIGRKRDHDLLPGVRSFPADRYIIVYTIEDDGAVLILNVIAASRDIGALFSR